MSLDELELLTKNIALVELEQDSYMVLGFPLEIPQNNNSLI